VFRLKVRTQVDRLKVNRLKAGSYKVFGEGEYIIVHQDLQSKSLQPIYLDSYKPC